MTQTKNKTEKKNRSYIHRQDYISCRACGGKSMVSSTWETVVEDGKEFKRLKCSFCDDYIYLAEQGEHQETVVKEVVKKPRKRKLKKWII